MPKLKTRRAAAKRFRITGSGKVMRRKAFKNHLLQHKTTGRKNKLSKPAVLDKTDEDRVKLMMPYLGVA
jgi:large subunit ribosomal protein L35